MRVLILTFVYAPNRGGAETHLSDLTTWLAGRGDIQVDVLTYQPLTTPVKAPARETHGPLRIFRMRWFGMGLFHRLESKPLLQFLYLGPRLLLGAVWHVLRHGRPDVVNAHGLVAIWAAGWLRALFRLPVLGCLHAVYAFPPGSTTATRMAGVVRGADRLLTLSNASVAQWVSYGLPASRVGRFTYWIDLNHFSPSDRRASRALNDWDADALIVLFVGRLIPIKGASVMIDLAHKHPDVRFVIVGEGPMEAEIRQAALTLPNLHFMGALANEALPDLYRGADVLLVPSQYEEGFGRVVCEALACGTPVIASRRGGLVEALEGSPGILCADNAEAFSGALEEMRERLRTDPPLRDACRAFAEARFGPPNAAALEAELRSLKRSA
jgi:glycosyltransferase involved in cell wall biosynthesis